MSGGNILIEKKNQTASKTGMTGAKLIKTFRKVKIF
jgi:hypothetical protein